MKKPLPIGISDFKILIEGGYAYVDKTLLIQELIEKGDAVALIPRLRRFGKTLNLSMLKYFAAEEPEKIYHAFILGMLIGLKDKYDVRSNRESG